jgi:Tol biopolymer transport system component
MSDRSGNSEIWKATSSPAGFLSPGLVSTLNSAGVDWVPRLSFDGLSVYLSSDRGGTFDIWRTTRRSTDEEFSAPVLVTELNTSLTDLVGTISPDNCRIYGQSQGVAAMATRQL